MQTRLPRQRTPPAHNLGSIISGPMGADNLGDDVATITVTVDGDERKVDAGTTGTEIFADRREVVVMRVGESLVDLAHALADGDAVEAVTIDSPDGLTVLRHSTTHVLAQAVQRINPQARLGIGPPITDGFYYDFDVAEPFTPEDLKAIEKEMERIVKEGQSFVRTGRHRRGSACRTRGRAVQVRTHRSEERRRTGAEGASVEVGAGDLTIYDNVAKDGTVVWKDLCRGPHLPTTRLIGNGWSLMRSAAAYWRGSEKNPQLQRIYGTAWPTKDELVAYRDRLAEAERRDHRRLGAELDLFSFPDEIGSGLAVFHPKGGIVRMEMEEYSRRRHIEEGYEFVYSPHITKAQLFEISGHLDWYAEGMYPPMHMDEERDADGQHHQAGAGLLPQAHELPHAQPDLPLARALLPRAARSGCSSSARCTATRSPASFTASRGRAASPRTTPTSTAPASR